MKHLTYALLIVLCISSCSTKRQLVYLKDHKKNLQNTIDLTLSENKIEVGDILKIDIQSLVPEAAIPYNKNFQPNPNVQFLQLEGYLVNKYGTINLPVLGKINAVNRTLSELENVISQLLLSENHLTNPSVIVRRVNSKFTVLGEVTSPGTFSYFDETLTLFQALGYASDLTIAGKRKDITLIRESNGKRNVYKLSLTDSDILKSKLYHIKNNDIIIVNPSFAKVKSAGFLGSPSSIASFTSLILSITLLILNR